MPKPRLADARTQAVDEAELPDRREDPPLIDELLNFVQQRLALLLIEFGRLLLEHLVDVRIVPIDVWATLDREQLKPRGGVAEGTAAALDDALQVRSE